MIHPLTTVFDYGGDEILEPYEIRGYSMESGEKCRTCGRSKIRSTFRDNIRCKIERLKTGYWPDFISHKTPIVSERVAEALKEAKCTGFVIHPVTVTVEDRWADAPPYFAIEATTGQVEIYREELDESGGQVCPECHRRQPAKSDRYRFAEKRMLVRTETWSGEDFIRIGNVAHGFQLCSWKVVDLALRNSWTHSVFGLRTPRLSTRGGGEYDPHWRDKLALKLAPVAKELAQRYGVT